MQASVQTAMWSCPLPKPKGSQPLRSEGGVAEASAPPVEAAGRHANERFAAGTLPTLSDGVLEYIRPRSHTFARECWPASDDWDVHVRAGELYNEAVSRAHLNAYLDEAAHRAIGTEHDFSAAGDLDYTMLGDEPQDAASRVMYRRLFDKALKEDNARKGRNSRLVMSLSMAIFLMYRRCAAADDTPGRQNGC